MLRSRSLKSAPCGLYLVGAAQSEAAPLRALNLSRDGPGGVPG